MRQLQKVFLLFVVLLVLFSEKTHSLLKFQPKKASMTELHMIKRAKLREQIPLLKISKQRVFMLSDSRSRTQRLMETVPTEEQTGNAGGFTTYEGLLKVDAVWESVRNMKEGEAAGPRPDFVKEFMGTNLKSEPAFDVAVCGGTLGIFLACALQMKGLRVVVIERGALKGRKQDWNISKVELLELVKEGVLTEAELDQVISNEFNPMRVGFRLSEMDPGYESVITDVLNLGVRPSLMLELIQQRFKSFGGVVMENVLLEGVNVYSNGVSLSLKSKPELVAKMVLDCMGNSSPIVRQLRWGQKPDGVCLVVGSCGRGFKAENNKSGDLIYANGPIIQKAKSCIQYFWEAFPAGSGPTDRTTYMFAYMDAHPDRPSLQELMEDYWDLLPSYQNIKVEDLKLLRVMFGYFPTFKNSPLPPGFDRILQVGDASGLQSPLSFGGFVSLTRQFPRLSRGIFEAVREDLLAKEDLIRINAYQPSLSAAWMFQKAMSVAVGQNPDPNIIVNILKNNFASMGSLGEPVLRPFLQDVVQFRGLVRTLVAAFINDPLGTPAIVLHVGLPALVEWLGHLFQLGLFEFFYHTIGRAKAAQLSEMNKKDQFLWSCRIDQWKYGSGLDYRLPELPDK